MCQMKIHKYLSLSGMFLTVKLALVPKPVKYKEITG